MVDCVQAPSRAPFGRPLGLFGRLGAPFLGGLGDPWASSGDPGGALGHLGVPGGIWEVAEAEVRYCCLKTSFLEHAAGEAGATGEAGVTEVVSKTAPQTPPPTHAGGQDDGSYTNSLKP